MNTDTHGGKTMTGNTDNGGGRRGSRWRVAVWGTAAFLWLLPLVAMQLTAEVNLAETIAYGVILLAAAGTYELALALRTRNIAYRIAVGVAVAAALLLVWMHGAVGTEDDSPGLMFFGVLVVGIIGAIIARFRPQDMARALFGTALAQALVAVIAMIAWKQYFEILVLNGFFIALWVGSALLFRRASANRL